MSRAGESLAITLAAAAGIAALLVYRRRDGTQETLEVGDLEEITITASRLPIPASSSPTKGPTQRLGPWRIPAAGEQYRPLFEAAERAHGVPALLLARQAYQECRFRQDIIQGKVRSRAGAVGMMQIIPRWHPSIDPGDAAADERAALDPARAVDYAAKFLKQLYGRFGTWQIALAAYNAGPGNVVKYGGVPPFPETQAYVAEISRDVGLA